MLCSVERPSVAATRVQISFSRLPLVLEKLLCFVMPAYNKHHGAYRCIKSLYLQHEKKIDKYKQRMIRAFCLNLLITCVRDC